MQKEEFLTKVQNLGGLENEDQALKMTEVFLATLGEWLYRTECQKLAAQLPKEFESFLFDVHNPEQSSSEVLHYPLGEFYNRVKARTNVGWEQAVEGTKAVAEVLRQAVSAGQIEDVMRQLPDEFDELFEVKT